MVAPTREFAISSLVIVGASTLAFGLALGYFVERGLLDREWASTTAFVQSAARTHLRPADFGAAPPATSLEAGDRFEEFARQVRMLPDVRRLVWLVLLGCRLGSLRHMNPLERFVTGLRAATVLVSHDREFLARTVTRVVELDLV